MVSHTSPRTSSPHHPVWLHNPCRLQQGNKYGSSSTEKYPKPLSQLLLSQKLQISASEILKDNPWTFIYHLSLILVGLFFLWQSPFFPFSLPSGPLFHITWSFSVCYSICSKKKTHTRKKHNIFQTVPCLAFLSGTIWIAISCKIFSAEFSPQFLFRFLNICRINGLYHSFGTS